jgi:hypothetical protein
MNTQKSTHNWLNAILIFFVLVNILGDIANIVMWYISPAGMFGPAGAQGSLRGGSMASILGGDNALVVGSLILAAVAVTYVAAMFGLLHRQKWGAVNPLRIQRCLLRLAWMDYCLSPGCVS